jgi:hypothetical protein
MAGFIQPIQATLGAAKLRSVPLLDRRANLRHTYAATTYPLAASSTGYAIAAEKICELKLPWLLHFKRLKILRTIEPCPNSWADNKIGIQIKWQLQRKRPLRLL